MGQFFWQLFFQNGPICVIFSGYVKITMSLILHLDTGKIQNTNYELLFEIDLYHIFRPILTLWANGPHIFGPGRALPILFARFGPKWATGP